jgi:hypothetical protein
LVNVAILPATSRNKQTTKARDITQRKSECGANTSTLWWTYHSFFVQGGYAQQFQCLLEEKEENVARPDS